MTLPALARRCGWPWPCAFRAWPMRWGGASLVGKSHGKTMEQRKIYGRTMEKTRKKPSKIIHYMLEILILSDFHIFQRGRLKPSTRHVSSIRIHEWSPIFLEKTDQICGNHCSTMLFDLFFSQHVQTSEPKCLYQGIPGIGPMSLGELREQAHRLKDSYWKPN